MGGYRCLSASLLAKASGTSVILGHSSPPPPPGGRQACSRAAKPFIAGEPYTEGAKFTALCDGVVMSGWYHSHLYTSDALLGLKPHLSASKHSSESKPGLRPLPKNRRQCHIRGNFHNLKGSRDLMLLSSTFGTEVEMMAKAEMTWPASMPSPDLIYLVWILILFTTPLLTFKRKWEYGNSGDLSWLKCMSYIMFIRYGDISKFKMRYLQSNNYLMMTLRYNWSKILPNPGAWALKYKWSHLTSCLAIFSSV